MFNDHTVDVTILPIYHPAIFRITHQPVVCVALDEICLPRFFQSEKFTALYSVSFNEGVVETGTCLYLSNQTGQFVLGVIALTITKVAVISKGITQNESPTPTTGLPCHNKP